MNLLFGFTGPSNSRLKVTESYVEKLCAEQRNEILKMFHNSQDHPGLFHKSGLDPGWPGTPSLTLTHIGQPSSIPEPSTLALLGIGILGLASYGWRRG